MRGWGGGERGEEEGGKAMTLSAARGSQACFKEGHAERRGEGPPSPSPPPSPPSAPVSGGGSSCWVGGVGRRRVCIPCMCTRRTW